MSADEKLYLGLGGPAWQKDDTPVKFVCPVCGNRGYLPVYVKGKDGNWRPTSLSRCRGCTTVFMEPQLFSAERH